MLLPCINALVSLAAISYLIELVISVAMSKTRYIIDYRTVLDLVKDFSKKLTIYTAIFSGTML
jgi:hypothetical protein